MEERAGKWDVSYYILSIFEGVRTVFNEVV